MAKKGWVLVTGGCGYIGSHVVLQLSEAGYPVVVLDNLSTGFADSLLHDEKLVVGDVSNENVLEAIFSEYLVDAVMHFAASIVVPDSVAAPLAYYRNNTVGTLCLLDTCRRFNVSKFIFSSTAAVYGESGESKIAETSAVAPSSPYGRSKLMDEWILADLAHVAPLRYVTLRYFNVAGADPRGRIGQRFPKATHLIKVACEAATRKRPEVIVFGTDYPTPDGTGVRDYVHVVDVASAHLAALRYLENGGPSVALNCGYGRGYSVNEVLSEVRRLGGDFKVTTGSRRAGDGSSLIADTSAIRRVLGWEPRHAKLSDIVGHALAFERTLE